MSFEQTYPNISWWVREQGWIEVGHDEWSRHSFVRALDPGGLVWEGKTSYPTIDDALRAMDAALAEHVADMQRYA